MSKIKSALELALEKTADLKVDKEKLQEDEVIKKAKSVISLILSGDEEIDSWTDYYKNLDKKKQTWAMKAAGEVLLSNLNLPRINEDLKRLVANHQLMQLLRPDMGSQIDPIYEQAAGLFQQYLDNKDQVRQKLMEQVEQQLAQKEAMMSQQMGRQIQLTPQDDPEIMKMVSDQLKAFEDQYKNVIEQMKEELKKLF